MPFKELLEEYPLYKKFEAEIPQYGHNLDKPKITMHCQRCNGIQTFRMMNEYQDGQRIDPKIPFRPFGKTVFLRYLCQSCEEYQRYFVVNFGAKHAIKAGQFPPWDISGDPDIEKMLGEHATHYKRGLISESQGYGIGAFAYYRRIVEEIIDQLLDDISELLNDKEKEVYEEALKKTKETRVTADKIELVKDLLPPILRPDNMNPLAALHTALSEGLHAESDEECMKLALTVREILSFLVHQVAVTRASSRAFTEGMRNLLGRNTPKPVAATAAVSEEPVQVADSDTAEK